MYRTAEECPRPITAQKCNEVSTSLIQKEERAGLMSERRTKRELKYASLAHPARRRDKCGGVECASRGPLAWQESARRERPRAGFD